MFTHHIFQYLGCVEVFESRGMQVCEEAVKTLKSVSSESQLDKLKTPLTIKMKIQGIDSDWNLFSLEIVETVIKDIQSLNNLNTYNPSQIINDW